MTEENVAYTPSIADVIAGFDQLSAELRGASTPVLVVYLKQARELVAQARTFAESLEALYVQRFEAGDVPKQTTYEGVGTVEVKRSNSRTQWDHESLWARAVARALDEREVDPGTGEFEREADVVARVLRECATPSWKVTGLKAHGIDADEFCTTNWGKHSVVLT